MQIISLGKVAPAAAGTPVVLSTLVSDPEMKIHSITVSQIPGTTGNTYFGTATMVKATYVGVMRAFLPPGASGFLDAWETPIQDEESNGLRLKDFSVDADTNAMGLLVVLTVV